jgi:fluoride ion exporter CrcB/FEX
MASLSFLEEMPPTYIAKGPDDEKLSAAAAAAAAVNTVDMENKNEPDEGNNYNVDQRIFLSDRLPDEERAGSFDEVERLNKLNDQIQLLPSAQNIMILKTTSPSPANINNQRQPLHLDGDFFPLPDAREDSLFEFLEQHSSPLRKIVPYQFRRQRSTPITSIEFQGDPFLNLRRSESDTSEESHILLIETQALKPRFRKHALCTLQSAPITSTIIGERENTSIRKNETGHAALGGGENKSNRIKSPIEIDHTLPTGRQLHHRTHAKGSSEVKEMEESLQSNDNRRDPILERRHFQYILYLSAFAIFGSTIRVYLARLFGGDCEQGDKAVNDFLTPLSKNICVTVGGRTLQTGGALFLDLPANMIGSLIMGLITPLDPEIGLQFPWYVIDHPLQQDDVLHAAFSVGFCGSLTTFASWNSQMVVMLVSNNYVTITW